MSERLRLPLLGDTSELEAPRTPPTPRDAGDHPVVALLGEDAEVVAFAAALARAMRGELAAVVPAYGPARAALQAARVLHVLGVDERALDAFCAALPARMPILCLGAAAHALTPSVRVGLGRVRNASTTSYDLWLGYSYERVAQALGAVLGAAR